MKKWLISLLALTCAFGFVGCGGTVEDSSSQGGSMEQSSSEVSSSLDESAPESSDSSEIESVPEEESSSAEEVLPESSDASEEGEDVDSTQQEQPITEEQKAALQAVFEGFYQSMNCTIESEFLETVKAEVNGIKGYEYYKSSIIETIDGNKSREDGRYWMVYGTGEWNGEWDYDGREVEYCQTIDERTEYWWYYDEEDKVWQKDENTISDEEYESWLENIAEEKRLAGIILDNLYYNAESGLYVTKDLVLYESEEDEVRLGKLVDFCLEMKDGKLYQIKYQLECLLFDYVDFVESEEKTYITSTQEVTFTFTEWGTTVVNLPKVDEE